VKVISIHTPETAAERDPANVAKALKDLRVTYPVLLDQDGANWRRWEQRWWPTVYLIDRKGIIRYGWEGELEFNRAGGEAKMARAIQQLLAEKG
jgi:AhpC/TSA family